MCSLHSKQLSQGPGHNEERKMLLVSAEEGADMVLEVTTERRDFFLRLNDYKLSKKIMEFTLSEHTLF